jgi:hypothetical protein
MGFFQPAVVLSGNRVELAILKSSGEGVLNWYHPSENCLLTCWRAMCLLQHFGSLNRGTLCLSYYASFSKVNTSAMAREARTQLGKRVDLATLPKILSSIPDNFEAVFLSLCCKKIPLNITEVIAAVTLKQFSPSKNMKRHLRKLERENALYDRKVSLEKVGRLLPVFETNMLPNVLKETPLGGVVVRLLCMDQLLPVESLVDLSCIAIRDPINGQLHLMAKLKVNQWPGRYFLRATLCGGIRRSIEPVDLEHLIVAKEVMISLARLNRFEELQYLLLLKRAKLGLSINPLTLPGLSLVSATIVLQGGKLVARLTTCSQDKHANYDAWLTSRMQIEGCVLMST